MQVGAPSAAPLAPREVRALARAWPGLFGEVEPSRPGTSSEPQAEDLLSMLRDEFGVDVDDLDEGLRDALRDDDPTR